MYLRILYMFYISILQATVPSLSSFVQFPLTVCILCDYVKEQNKTILYTSCRPHCNCPCCIEAGIIIEGIHWWSIGMWSSALSKGMSIATRAMLSANQIHCPEQDPIRSDSAHTLVIMTQNFYNSSVSMWWEATPTINMCTLNWSHPHR